MDNESIINEVFGGQHRALTGQTANPGSHLANAANSRLLDQHGIVAADDQERLIRKQMANVTKPGFIPKNWQHLITTKIIAGNANLFVNIAPSAGKTHPIMMSFFDLLKRARPGSIPKILWVAETKLLSSQILNQLREILFKSLFTSLKSDNMSDDKTVASMPKFMIEPYFYDVPGFGQHTGPINNFVLPPNAMQRMHDMVGRWTGQKMGGVDGVTSDTIAMTCTYEFATKMISQHNPAIVVIDEVQERFKPELSDPESESTKVRHFFNNIVAADNSNGTSSIVLTGSMNHATALYIRSYLNNYLKHKMEYIRFDTPSTGFDMKLNSTGERNKARITVLPTDLVRKDIPKLIVDHIKGKSTNNLIMVFNKRIITDFTEQVISSTSPRNMAAVMGIKSANITDQYVSPSRQPHADPIHTIGSVAEKASRGSTMDQIYKMYENMKDIQLKEAVSHGFGYIMSGDDEPGGPSGRMYSPDDIQVVEELYKRGMIYSIIATTSVGVGVNLKVRAIYIPSIDVFSKEFGNPRAMSNSSLAQLVHRAGRKIGEAAIVYCNKKDLLVINQIMMSGDPSTQVEPIPYSTKSLGTAPILDRFNYARSKWYRDNTIYQLIFGRDKR